MTKEDRELLAEYYNRADIKDIDLDTLQAAYDMGIENQPKGFIDNNFRLLDKDKQRDIARQGGIASGQVRKQKADRAKAAREILDYVFLQSGLQKQDLEDFRKWQRHKRYLENKKKRQEQACKDK